MYFSTDQMMSNDISSGTRYCWYKPKKAPEGERNNPSVTSLREIKHYQKRTDMVIPKLPFMRYLKVLSK